MPVYIHVHDSDMVHTFDDANWEESKHPRKNNGQFGTGNVAKTVKVHTSTAVTPILKKYGYKSVGGTEEHHEVFEGPNGKKVTIHHPTPGKASASKWESHAPGFTPKAGGGINLEKLLASLAAREGATLTPEPEKPPTDPYKEPTKQHVMGKLVEGMLSYEKTESVDPEHAAFKKGKSLVTVAPDGSWVASSKGHMTKAGPDFETLSALMNGKLMPGVKNASDVPLQHQVNATYGEASAETIAKAKQEAEAKLKAQAEAAAEQKAAMEKHAAEKAKAEAAYAGLHAVAKKGATFNEKAMGVLKAVKPEEAEHYAHIVAHTTAPTKAQESAIKVYTGNGYDAMNMAMRYDSVESSPYAGTIDNMTAYLNDSKLAKPAKLWRGVKPDIGKPMRSLIFPGAIIMEKGFMSTSVSENFSNAWAGGTGPGKDGILMELDVPAGTPAQAVTHQGGANEGEAEVLLQRRRAIQITHWDAKSGRAKGKIINLEDES